MKLKMLQKVQFLNLKQKLQGRAVNIILFLSESSKRSNSGLDKISPTKDA